MNASKCNTKHMVCNVHLYIHVIDCFLVSVLHKCTDGNMLIFAKNEIYSNLPTSRHIYFFTLTLYFRRIRDSMRGSVSCNTIAIEIAISIAIGLHHNTFHAIYFIWQSHYVYSTLRYVLVSCWCMHQFVVPFARAAYFDECICMLLVYWADPFFFL